MTTITVNFNDIIQLSDDQFYQLCRNNPDIKFERNVKGEIVIMPPTGGGTGNRNIEIGADFVIWNRQAKLGVLFDSSTCFKLPNGANRSPDISWVRKDRWDTLTAEQQEKFPAIPQSGCQGHRTRFCFRVDVTDRQSEGNSSKNAGIHE